MSNSSRKLTVPTMPQGVEVASFGSYLDAQAAVDLLSDKAFPVQFVTIVGTDLKMVERVTGRLTYGRVTLAGLAAGAWFGLFVGILLFMFGGSEAGLSVLSAIALGAGFGALFSLISYSFTGGKRDFTSSSQIVAAAYTVLCASEHAGAARELLRSGGMDQRVVNQGGGLVGSAGSAQQRNPYAAPTGPTTAAGAPGAGPMPPASDVPEPAPRPESKPDSMYVTSDGRPRYGALRPDNPVTPAADAERAQAAERDSQNRDSDNKDD